MEEDPDKIKELKDKLNKEAGADVWDDVIGIHQMLSVNLKTNTISPDTGLTVKCFVNLETWEIKTYYFKHFIKD